MSSIQELVQGIERSTNEPEDRISFVDLLEIIKKQQERIERLERKLEAYIDRQAAYEFEGF